jgi:hypothetical protein
VSLWTSSASPRRTDFDVFQDYEKQFQLVPGSATPPGYSYRFQLGKVHRVTLQVAEKDRTLRFIADGLERVQRKVSRLKSLGWVEVRAWNNPIVLKELVVEGVLER